MREPFAKFGRVNPKTITWFCLYPFYFQICLTCIAIFLNVQNNITLNAPIQAFLRPSFVLVWVSLLISIIRIQDKKDVTGLFFSILISIPGINYVIEMLVKTPNPLAVFVISLFYISPFLVIVYSRLIAPKGNQKSEVTP